MARKLLLNDELTSVLRSRVFLIESVRLFSLRDLTEHWEIHINTIHRYKSDKYREYSREYSRMAYLEHKKTSSSRGNCYRCGEPHREHPRCAACTILIHNEDITCGGAGCIGALAQGMIHPLTALSDE